MKDNRYYTVISRDGFINILKDGDINIIKVQIIENSNNLENDLFELFKTLPFHYEDDYVILEVDYKSQKSNFNQMDIFYNLKIEKIKKVYTLSEKAQFFYKTKVNQKIYFKIINFPNLLNNILEDKELKNIQKGVDIFTKRFDFMDERNIFQRIGEDLKKNYLDELKKELKYPNMDFKSFYIDLLFYKRQNKFENEAISYIYDFIVIRRLKERDEDNKKLYISKKISVGKIEETLENKKEITLVENVNIIMDSEEDIIKKFVDKIETKEFISGIIFLALKDLFNKNNDKRPSNYIEIREKIITDFSIKYKEELSIAFYLIGLYFGYENLCSYYYLDLPIFKEEIEKTPTLVEENKEEIDYKKKFEELQKENEELKIKFEEEKPQNDLTLETISQENNTLQASRDNEIKKLSDEKLELEDRKKVLEDSLNSKDTEAIREFLKKLPKDGLVKTVYKHPENKGKDKLTEKDIKKLEEDELINKLINYSGGLGL